MIGDMPLNKITPLIMSTFLGKLRDELVSSQALSDDKLKRKRTPSDQAKLAKNMDKTLSPRTIRHYHDTLSSIFKQGVFWEMMYRNPMDGRTSAKSAKEDR